MTTVRTGKMKRRFRIWTAHMGVVDYEAITGKEWTQLCQAAGFTSVSGRSADDVLCDSEGFLWLMDSCGEVRAVDPNQYMAAE